jgi:hypothetical protein
MRDYLLYYYLLRAFVTQKKDMIQEEIKGSAVSVEQCIGAIKKANFLKRILEIDSKKKQRTKFSNMFPITI